MQGFSWKQGGLAAGTYSSVHAVFPGATQGSTTWTPADSLNTPLPYASFTVQPVSSSSSRQISVTSLYFITLRERDF